VPLASTLARAASNRDPRDGPAVALQGLESLLALAVTSATTIGSQTAFAGDEGAHSSHGSCENVLWGQKRIQAELARLGYLVSARTVAKYMRRVRRGPPSPNWRTFLSAHAREIWACGFFCVQTILFRTIYVFFIIHHASREVVHVRTTRHPTSEWTGRQIVEACGWEREPPRFLIHDRDSRYGIAFDLRLRALGIRSVRTPFRSPQANAIAERWVKSVRTESLDHYLILNERHLRRILSEYVTCSTAGDRTARLGNNRRVLRCLPCGSQSGTRPASPPDPCSVVCTTCTNLWHDMTD